MSADVAQALAQVSNHQFVFITCFGILQQTMCEQIVLIDVVATFSSPCQRITANGAVIECYQLLGCCGHQGFFTQRQTQQQAGWIGLCQTFEKA